MTNQYEALPLAALREAAKSKGLKGITALRKQELIDVLLAYDQEHDSSRTIGQALQEKKEERETKELKPMAGNEGAGTADKTKRTADRIAFDQDKSSEKANTTHRTRENGHDLKLGNKETTGAEKKEEKPMERSETVIRPDSKSFVRPSETKADSRMDYRTDNRNEIKSNYRSENRMDARNDYRTENRNDMRNNRYENRNDTRPDYRNENRTEGVNDYRAENRMEIKHEVKPETENSTHRKTSYGSNDMEQLDSGETKEGILEVMPDGYGFIRCDNFLPGENDVYVSPAQIRRFNLKTGDIVAGNTRIRNQNEKFSALLYVKSVNGFSPLEAQKRKRFEDLTPIFPDERIHLETSKASLAMRMVDLISPIGKGQRGMIVSQPKTGKTTLLKQIAKAITANYPEMHLIILLIDERPEEVTDIKESIQGSNVEVIYSTFDELPENHKRVSEMVIERAKRLVEHKKDVVILLDSITRLARAYNLTVQASGRTLSGGLDPAALHMPKKFFGAARNMREGGSLTILATALVDTGSRMDDVVFEEFKGTGNMELVLDRSLSEKRIFPAIDLPRSSTRRDDLLLSAAEQEAVMNIRKALNSVRSDEALERIIDMFVKTKTNQELVEVIRRTKIIL